jgi:hypothetical protein
MAAPGFESGGPFRQVPLRYFGYANERKRLRTNFSLLFLLLFTLFLSFLSIVCVFSYKQRCSQRMGISIYSYLSLDIAEIEANGAHFR